MRNIKKYLIVLVVLSFILLFATSCVNTGNETSESAFSETESTYPELKIETSNDENRLYESMEYTFIPDDEIIGKWQAVNAVEKIEDFETGKLLFSSPEKLYWQSCIFFDSGLLSYKFSNSKNATEKWTKGYVLYSKFGVIPAYTLKQIDGKRYMFVEWKIGDYPFTGKIPCYYVFEKTSDNAVFPINAYDDVRNEDILVADLSSFDKKILTLKFNEKTIFPAREKMPARDEYQPDYIMEAGKNPGLGVRSIHDKGITGKGVTVAIIDQPLYIDSHPEYAGKIIEYKDFGCKLETSIHGPAVTSLLVGETVGTAPGAKIYYAAVPSWNLDATCYADAVDWIVETNKNLPDGEKIRVISISGAPTHCNDDWTNGEKYLESVKRATEARILILDCSSENGMIGACGYDFDNPEDVSLCKPGYLNNPVWNKDDILVPVQYRTLAEEYFSKGDITYQYTGEGGLSWGIPYVAGVLAMGWEVTPELTADEIIDILFDTAYVDSSGYKYINPTAFISYLSSKE